MVIIFIFWVSSLFKKPENKQLRRKQKNSLARDKFQKAEDKKEEKKEDVPQVDIEPVDLDGIIAYIKMKYSDPAEEEMNDPFAELDPRAVLDTTVMDFTQLELSGIIWEEDEPVALINDKILSRGDMVSGFKIFEIRKSEVVLIKGLERYILKLPAQIQEEE